MLNIEDLKRYVNEHRADLLLRDGDCKSCPVSKKCHDEKLRNFISNLKFMTEDDTAHPFLLKFLKIVGFDIVPNKVYDYYIKKNLPDIECYYRADKVVINWDKIEKAFQLFSDDYSKDVFLRILFYRLTLEHSYIDGLCSDEEQYFITGFNNLSADEIFVDAGGFTGDTLKSYLKYNSVPKLYYFYEPSHLYIKNIESIISKNNAKDYVRVRLYGLFDSKRTLEFKQMNGGVASCKEFSVGVTKEFSYSINTITLDEDVNERVSFIKLDMEGSEKEALRGAKNILEKCKPRLAICVYHYINDIWDIPLQIFDIYGTCAKYQIRHHSVGATESVLYVSQC